MRVLGAAADFVENFACAHGVNGVGHVGLAPVAGARVEIWQVDHQGIYLHPGDPAVAKRAFDAMMTMQKIDVATIEAARRS